MEYFKLNSSIVFSLKDYKIHKEILDKSYFLMLCNNDEKYLNAYYLCNFTLPIYDVISGEDIIKNIDNGNSYNNCRFNVIINNYSTNLGLLHKDVEFGKCLVDKTAWLDLCKTNNIVVNVIKDKS